jgi:DNA-binding transcriptional regulator GbsR (MarR family)
MKRLKFYKFVNLERGAMADGKNDPAEKAKAHIIKSAGWITQDFGLGRILGEVMAHVYLSEHPTTLEEMEKALELSKAAVSIATRQLDKLSLIERVRVAGDRRAYYKTSEHFAASLRQGILEMVRAKLKTAEDVFEQAETILNDAENEQDVAFLKSRIGRARDIRGKVDRIVNNPLLKLIGG